MSKHSDWLRNYIAEAPYVVPEVRVPILAAADALDAAEKAIKNAPHADDCPYNYNYGPLANGPCDCWKREALEHFTDE